MRKDTLNNTSGPNNPSGAGKGPSAAHRPPSVKLRAAAEAGQAAVRRAPSRRERDAATGLYNERGLKRAFDAASGGAYRQSYYLLCFRFELWHIEHMGGPGAARRFARGAADVLLRSAPDGSAAARGGSGDFFVLCRAENAMSARDWAMAAAGEIERAGHLSRRDVSVGIFPLSARAGGFEQALYHSRQCAVSAAREGMGVKICGADNCLACERERELLRDAGRALEDGQFRLYLQPIVGARDHCPVGAEALSRWEHPRLGLLGPGKYVPLLESEGGIEHLDLYNLERTCELLEQLDGAGRGDFFISCNLSRRTFVLPDLPERCRAILSRHVFAHRSLVVEMTESGYVHSTESERMRENIRALHGLGLRVMLDDFGMGYTAFHDLLDFPMDGLKLDKSLVDNMGTEQGRIVLDGIVRTGHRLGLYILAEGVEEDWQVDALRELDCDMLQGYLFSRPMPAEEALAPLTHKDK